MSMDLEELLAAMDATSANLIKLYDVLDAAEKFYPEGPSAGSPPEYDQLARIWSGLLVGLPPINGLRVSVALPDIDQLGRAYVDYIELGMPPFAITEELQTPRKQLDEYKYHLEEARATAVSERLELLCSAMDDELSAIGGTIGVVRTEHAYVIGETLEELARLLGELSERGGRWSDFRRHLRFGEDHDWQDIMSADWPSVREDVRSAMNASNRPLPVPAADLGVLAANKPSGGVAHGYDWSLLTADQFERLLNRLLGDLPGHENVEWLTRTNAPDRGRDLSADRVFDDGTGFIRRERVIVQAKHWQSRSIALQDITASLAAAQLWDRRFQVLVIATSGRFTTDAIEWVEKHNDRGDAMRIELWPDNRLEEYLAARPGLAALFGL